MEGYLDQFADHLKAKDASANTVRNYINDLRNFLKWVDSSKATELEQITPLDIAEYKRHLSDLGRMPATINRAVVSLHQFFGWAISMGLIPDNPAEEIKRVHEVKGAPRSITRKEQMALMRAVKSSGSVRDIAIVTLLMHTGIRVSELCKLEVKDVIIKERNGNIAIDGKGQKRRKVPLNATARKALSDWLKERGEVEGKLFTGRMRNQIGPRNVEYLLKKYSYHARIDNVTPHSLRHTFCKSLVDAGESLDRVALLAGHSSLNTTVKYTRPGDQEMQEAVDKIAWE